MTDATVPATGTACPPVCGHLAASLHPGEQEVAPGICKACSLGPGQTSLFKLPQARALPALYRIGAADLTEEGVVRGHCRDTAFCLQLDTPSGPQGPLWGWALGAAVYGT